MKTLLATVAVVLGIATAPAALAQTLGVPSPSFSTENSASQNRIDQSPTTSGYRLVTENSASQNRVSQLQTAPAAVSSGFRWADAGIGASAAVGAMLLLVGGAAVVLRRRGEVALAG